MSAGINWRSGNLDVIMTRDFDKSTHTFKSVQSIDFAFDDNVEVMDSLNQQRIGYFLPPRRIRITLTVLPVVYIDNSVEINDSSILAEMQSFLMNDTSDYTNAFFSLKVTDQHQGSVYEFVDCIAMEGSTGDIIMDQRPVSQWTILSLNSDMTTTEGSKVTTYSVGGNVSV